MAVSQLPVTQVTQMVLHVCRGMEGSKDLLTQADKAIGDGDHGVGMARGFEAVCQKVSSQPFASVGDVFKAVGTALLTSVGGASGAIFGTLFRGGASRLGDRQALDAASLAMLLCDGLRAVQERGKAQPGDKTMVDALEPASQMAQTLTTVDLDEALIRVTEAARLGMESTKDMVAALGKSQSLGERSLGHPDPGALSTYLILKFMTEYVRQVA
jgi:dihydroxyacetone kinase-like protein